MNKINNKNSKTLGGGGGYLPKEQSNCFIANLCALLYE